MPARKPGDVLFLTKPIGTGIVGTAIKFGRAPEALVAQAVASMRTLNKGGGRGAARAGRARLHRHHRVRPHRPRRPRWPSPAAVTIELEAAAVPLFDGVLPLWPAPTGPADWRSNRAHFADRVHLASAHAEALADLFFDPQTSGGLLVTVAAADRRRRRGPRWTAAGVPAARVGHATGPIGPRAYG